MTNESKIFQSFVPQTKRMGSRQKKPDMNLGRMLRLCSKNTQAVNVFRRRRHATGSVFGRSPWAFLLVYRLATSCVPDHRSQPSPVGLFDRIFAPEGRIKPRFFRRVARCMYLPRAGEEFSVSRENIGKSLEFAFSPLCRPRIKTSLKLDWLGRKYVFAERKCLRRFAENCRRWRAATAEKPCGLGGSHAFCSYDDFRSVLSFLALTYLVVGS